MKNKNLLLVLFGFIPLVIGFLINWLIMTFETTFIAFNLIPFLFLFLWFILGFYSNKFKDNFISSLIIIHLPIFLALILNLYQEIILGEYFSNIIGTLTQFFFLPVLSLTFNFSFFTNRLWHSYIIAFIYMCLSYYLGYLFKKRRK